MTDSSFSDDSLDYYKEHNSKVDPHSRRIQDDLRCDVAIAVAGAIAQLDLCGVSTLIESECDRDVKRANCGAAHIHRGLNPPHRRFPWDRCQFCEAYLEKTRSTVKQMLAEPLVRASIKALAADKLESLENSIQREGSEVEEFFQDRGLSAGSEIDSLRPVPTPDQSSEKGFASLLS